MPRALALRGPTRCRGAFKTYARWAAASPQGRQEAPESVPVAAVYPRRRAGRADVARGRVHPLGARVPDGCEPRADGVVALLAPALLLALEGRVHPGPGARLRARHGPSRARADDRIPHRSGRGRPDRTELPDRG